MAKEWFRTRQARLLLLALAALGLAGLPFCLLRSGGFGEPVYGGRNLTFWMRPLAGLCSNDNTTGIIPAHAALIRPVLNELGTNAVPCFLHLFRKRPSPSKIWANRLLAKQSLIKFRFPPEPNYRELAHRAFLVIGPQEPNVIPGLIQLLQDEDEDETRYVKATLWYMLPDSAPALITALTNQNRLVRCNAALSLVGHPGARSAIPALKVRLQDPEPKVRLAAAIAVIWVPGRSDEALVVSVLRQLLKERDQTVRLGALYTFGNFGIRDKSVVPDLLEMLQDSDVEFRTAVADALLDLDARAAHKAGVWHENRDPFLKRTNKRKVALRWTGITLAIVVPGIVGIIFWQRLRNASSPPHSPAVSAP